MKEVIFSELHPTPLRDLGDGYINAYVTFIDILGFGNLVDTVTPTEIRKQLSAMKYFHSLPQRREQETINQNFQPISTQFSDSIIRIQPVPSENNELDTFIAENFITELTSLLLAQGNLACNGIFIRGGMTFGQVSVSEFGVYGPAFNRAYKIESTLSCYPRIVIDQKLINCFRGPLQKDGWEDISEYVQRDADGQWFIQYLSHLCEASLKNGLTALDVLKAHRDKIQGNLQEALSKDREEIAVKYFWVANYHNRLIENTNYSTVDKDLFNRSGESLFVNLEHINSKQDDASKGH